MSSNKPLNTKKGPISRLISFFQGLGNTGVTVEPIDTSQVQQTKTSPNPSPRDDVESTESESSELSDSTKRPLETTVIAKQAWKAAQQEHEKSKTMNSGKPKGVMGQNRKGSPQENESQEAETQEQVQSKQTLQKMPEMVEEKDEEVEVEVEVFGSDTQEDMKRRELLATITVPNSPKATQGMEAKNQGNRQVIGVGENESQEDETVELKGSWTSEVKSNDDVDLDEAETQELEDDTEELKDSSTNKAKSNGEVEEQEAEDEQQPEKQRALFREIKTPPPQSPKRAPSGQAPDPPKAPRMTN